MTHNLLDGRAHGSTLSHRGADVWHVTDEGKKKNEIKTERQRDAIAKSTILSFVCDSVSKWCFCLHKYTCAFGTISVRTMETQIMCK